VSTTSSPLSARGAGKAQKGRNDAHQGLGETRGPKAKSSNEARSSPKLKGGSITMTVSGRTFSQTKSPRKRRTIYRSGGGEGHCDLMGPSSMM